MAKRVDLDPEPLATAPTPVSIDPRAVLHRLPLADAVLRLLAYVLNPLALDGLFRDHRAGRFKVILPFGVFTHLIADALLQDQGSGRRSFQRAQEQGRLPTSIRAVYDRLAGLPMSLSLGVLEAASARLRAFFPDGARAWDAPACVADLTPVILDGKALKKVAKRLKATRAAPGKISGGKLLVAMTPRSGMVLTMAADLDGEANEARLVPELLSRVNALIPERRLWIADRQYGDPVQIGRFLERPEDHVVVRRDGKTSFHVDPAVAAQATRDAEGRAVVQDGGWLGAESNPNRRRLRRIRLERPGQESIILLTDLESEATHPAGELLEVYRERWGIERVFQKITEVFSLGRLIGSTPQAAIFQAAFCLVLYNLIQVVRGVIAGGRDEATTPLESISSEQVFHDAHRQLIAVTELVSPTDLASALTPALGQEAMRAWLHERVRGLWSERWRKAKNAKARAKKPSQGSCYGAHNSVQRLILQHKSQTDST